MDKPLPANDEAEQAVLGSLLIAPRTVAQVAPILRPEHFQSARHRALYELLLDLDPSEYDGLIIKDGLKRDGRWERFGGYDWLAGLIAAVPSPARVLYYADLVVEAWRRRQLVGIGYRLTEAAGGSETGSRELIADTVEELYSLDSGPPSPSGLGDLLKDALAAVERRLIPTDLAELDALSGGLKAGELTVPGARPGVGKSSFMLTIAANIAQRNTPVVFVTLELTAVAVSRRLLAAQAGVPVLGMVRGDLTENQEWRVHLAANAIKDLPLHIVNPRERDARTVASLIRLAHMRHGIAAAFVDYIQLVRSGRRAEKRYIEIGQVVDELKALALELEIPVVAAAQLRREADTRARPGLGDLRESGDIEQTADNVWLLHRPRATITDGNGCTIVDGNGFEQDRQIARLWVEKARDGETTGHDGIKLRFELPGMRFRNYTPEPSPPPEPDASPAEPAPSPPQRRLGNF
ncbi:MAG: DnaB-like helicase C-terminal domain-containing protein [Pseudomonadota bacterium]